MSSVDIKKYWKQLEVVFGEDKFGFRSGKWNINAVVMLGIITERTLDTAE
jgi:hypothetical protein